MYTINVTYRNTSEIETLICNSHDDLDISVVGGSIFLDCGNGQQFVLNIASVVKVAIEYPLPTKIHTPKHVTTIHYQTPTDDTELFLSCSDMDIAVDGCDGGYEPVIVVINKDHNKVVRLISSSQLRSIKVDNYSEPSGE